MAKKIMLFLVIFFISVAWCNNTATNNQLQAINFDTVFMEDSLAGKLCVVRETEKKFSEELEAFIFELSMSEGSGNPDTINTIGYIGTFSFGRAALKEVGYGHITLKDFKENPKIFPLEDQKDAVVKLLKINHNRLRVEINSYEGKVIDGITITKSGLLAAAHLAGPGGVKSYLRSNGEYNPSDLYGTKLSSYLENFKGYNINLD